MTKITPILLAGGSGKRLWPLSRKSYPKQFSNLLGKTSLFQESAKRLVSSDLIQFECPMTLSNNDFRFIISEQLQNVGVTPGPIIIEPYARNTAPAILAASILAFENNSESILLVAPSDHVMPHTEMFHKTIIEGMTAVEHGDIVTFGINPTSAETGYGYIELSQPTRGNPVGVKDFIEKPVEDTAKKMLKHGGYLWNSGIFLFSASSMISAFKEYSREVYLNVKQAIDGAVEDLGFLRLEKNSWGRCENISIDYAIMEKISNICVVPYDGFWSDLGGWNAVWKEMKPDENGMVLGENAHSIDCKNSLLRAENNNQHIVGLGVENIIAIAMPDAVLIADKRKVQDTKKVVDLLKEKGISQAENFPKDHRPWGWFESLTLSDRFQVKRILVNPGAALSLQSHHHRSEHWIVVEGTAKVTINQSEKLISEGESVYIPLGSIHRMENPGKFPMVLIEVQTGSYLGEDDIVRYEDLYKRNQNE